MIEISPRRPFEPHQPDAAGVISWVHIGDLHMTLAGEENHLNLLRIVEQVNAAFAGSIAFVFIPGDVADHGSTPEYQVVRGALDMLTVPWCSIVGDHDVHEKSFANYQKYMAPTTHYKFKLGEVSFFALNAFDVPDPGSFILLSSQLEWLEAELETMGSDDSAVLLLHCYPTDLKQGGSELQTLVAEHDIRVIEMGHTHYNEVANDGKTLFIATRSTGQIEEGPAGFSVTNIDGPVVSWKFFALNDLPAIVITSPADERFFTDDDASSLALTETVVVRAKVWGMAPISSVSGSLGDVQVQLHRVDGSNVWEAGFPKTEIKPGVHPLRVQAIDESGKRAADEIRIVFGSAAYNAPQRAERDQDNALTAWPEHGLLGTQLGPNKFGKKW